MYTAYQEYANPAALYRSALHTKQTVEKARLTVAENLGCTPDHIFFTSGGSESNTWAIRGTVPQGGHVVTTPIEHHSVLNACASIRDDGGRMTTLEVDGFGRVVPESLTRAGGPPQPGQLAVRQQRGRRCTEHPRAGSALP